MLCYFRTPSVSRGGPGDPELSTDSLDLPSVHRGTGDDDLPRTIKIVPYRQGHLHYHLFPRPVSKERDVKYCVLPHPRSSGTHPCHGRTHLRVGVYTELLGGGGVVYSSFLLKGNPFTWGQNLRIRTSPDAVPKLDPRTGPPTTVKGTPRPLPVRHRPVDFSRPTFSLAQM